MGKILKLLWKIIQLAFIEHTVMGNGYTNIIKTISLPFAVYSLIGKYLTLQVTVQIFLNVSLKVIMLTRVSLEVGGLILHKNNILWKNHRIWKSINQV